MRWYSQLFAMLSKRYLLIIDFVQKVTIVSIFSLWDELLRLIRVGSFSIFTPTIFFKEGENTLCRYSRDKKYIQYLQYMKYTTSKTSLFSSLQLNTLKASSRLGLLLSLLSKCYSNCLLLFMRPKLQINCFETLSSWSLTAPRSNYMNFMTKCKKKKKKLKGQTFFTKSFNWFLFFMAKRTSKRYSLNYCDLSFSQIFI